MSMDAQARNLAALRAKPDRDLRDFIAGVLVDDAGYDAMWTLLLDPMLIERTVLMLSELVSDVDGQFAVAKQGESDQDWAARARKFKYLVTMRLGRAKYALKQQNLSAMKQVQGWQAAAHQLAAAIYAHEVDVRADDEQDDLAADVSLWSALDSITRPDGTSVRAWMDAHQAKAVAA